MSLTPEQYEELKAIKKKMEQGTAKPKEMKKLLKFTASSDITTQNELEKYIKSTGFESIEKFENHLNREIENENTVNGLAVIGGAALLVWLLTRK